MADENGATLGPHADKIIAIKERNIDEIGRASCRERV